MAAQEPATSLWATYTGEAYDRLQPLRIEMYKFYHELALDFVPFAQQSEFRMLELGCGTGTFLKLVLEKFPKVQCIAFDYSDEMLQYAAAKVGRHVDRVTFHQRDLNEGLPPDLGPFHLVSSFSTIHHLTDANKLGLLQQIHGVLEPRGWFFLIDAMSVYFDDDVFRLGTQRQRLRMEERFKQTDVGLEEAELVAELNAQAPEDSPEKDRIASLSKHLEWLRQAGFDSVDEIWHFWIEHFIIARK
jgi:SAM-dependent methyltransferase